MKPLPEASLLESYGYELPPEIIAQTPLANRSDSRLLVDLPESPQTSSQNSIKGSIKNSIKDRHISDLPDLLSENDLVVLNNTRVQKARLNLQKETGGKAEVIALAPIDPENSWSALINPSKKIKPGSLLFFEGNPVLEAGEKISPDSGERRISPRGKYSDIAQLLQELGNVPLPPYIHTPLENPERYQTVYSKKAERSAAAPTAGLHLTLELLEKMRAKKIQLAEVELQVGLATFSPIQAEDINNHKMHYERYVIPSQVMDLCRLTKERGGKITAVGTTVVRALESAALTGELESHTGLFIRPGFEFQIVDSLLTNFHLPRSTLLVLLSAFIGDRWRALYDYAMANGYRFLSFGDAMLVDKRQDQ